MTREEAAQILDGLHELLDIEGGKDWRVAVDALLLASAALREPAHEWVRTTDRLPENGDDWVVGLFLLDDGRTIPDTVPSGTVKRQIKMCPYWMPLPKLPGVDDD